MNNATLPCTHINTISYWNRESWMGWIPGFYSLIIFSSIYLMLPMFQGADKVFRKILVPLAGLDEMLMLSLIHILTLPTTPYV